MPQRMYPLPKHLSQSIRRIEDYCHLIRKEAAIRAVGWRLTTTEGAAQIVSEASKVIHSAGWVDGEDE